MIWLLGRTDKNYTCEQVAQIIGYSPDWVRKLVKRYNQHAEAGLQDQRKQNGHQPILSKAAQQPKRSLNIPKHRWICFHPMPAPLVNACWWLTRLGSQCRILRLIRTHGLNQASKNRDVDFLWQR
ncbi:MAG: helix-turn-helix domain-containing protein [Kiritimatiellae bacterium]|nr:helix-turn-helix domain-containing protein [Kiritimatiellia bacterium]